MSFLLKIKFDHALLYFVTQFNHAAMVNLISTDVVGYEK